MSNYFWFSASIPSWKVREIMREVNRKEKTLFGRLLDFDFNVKCLSRYAGKIKSTTQAGHVAAMVKRGRPPE